MADLTISSIRERLFNPTKHEKSVSRSSNPFAQTSFKGNVLTADVFVSENSIEKQDKVSFTGKLKASALVGSLSDMGSKLHAGIESVVAFARRMKNSVIDFWKTMDSMEITLQPAKDALARTGARMNDAINSVFDKGISYKEISKLELKNDDIYNNTLELFSGKVNAWSDSLAAV